VIPAHLDPAAEIPAPTPDATAEPLMFAREHDNLLCALAVPRWQRLQLLGVAALESAWGRNRGTRVHNPAGLKAKLDVARWHLRELGEPLRWFRQDGHTAQQDPSEVFYAAFRSAETFWRLWLARHVGMDSNAEPYARVYREAGALFWREDFAWCAALIRAGYSAWRTESGVLAAARSRQLCASRAERLLTDSRPT